MSVKKAWGGRFIEKNNTLFERMNRSLNFDIRLYEEDIKLNKVYSKELERIGVLSQEEYEAIEKGLDELQLEIKEKGLELFSEDTEDIHMGIESLLTKKIGDAAKKMHTGKSRNDQVATDLRLYVKKKTEEIHDLILELSKSFCRLAQNHLGVMMPGFTHLRQAQPVLLSHYLLSFVAAFERDMERFKDTDKRIMMLPLGSAALAGSAYPLDRENLRVGLGFESLSSNSMDGVLSRDFLLELLNNIAILATNLSRFAEDMIIFSSEQFDFFTLSDQVTTGSSIMPNKKNPDSLELTRGKTGRMIGNLMNLFTVIKGVPSTYNKDLQEDKEAVFDSIDHIIDILQINIILLETLQVNVEVMENAIDSFSFATELADYLAQQGMPFREAHHITGTIVLACINEKQMLTSLSEKDLLGFSEFFKGIGDDWGTTERFLSKRELFGGTGLNAVKKTLEEYFQKFMLF